MCIRDRSKNIGLDFGFFGNSLTGSFDVFQRDTKDMLGPTVDFPDFFGEMCIRDRAYVEQYDNYVKQTYRNRCVIAAADGPLALTIPTEKSGTPKCLMKDCLLYTST